MITHILGYLLCASVVFFFEVIFPLGLLGLVALALYGIAVVKAWMYFGMTGALATLVVGLVMAAVTAYWELRVLPRKRFAGVGFLKNRLALRARLSEPTADLKFQEGKATADMQPLGQVEIGRKTYAAESISGDISAGERIRVADVGVRGVKVEKI